MSLSTLIIVAFTACLFGYAATLFRPSIEIEPLQLVAIAVVVGLTSGWVLKRAYLVTGRDMAKASHG